MAKTDQYVKEINEQCRKKYGNIIKSGTDVLNNRRNHKLISISPSIDYGIGGGVKEGTLMLISGKDKSGKTSTALHIAAKHQHDESFVQPNGEKGRRVFYFNSEARLDEKHLEGVEGLDPDKMVILEKDEDKPCPPAEFLLNSALSVMRDPANKGAIVIIDSTSNMETAKQAERGVSSSFSDMPKVLADFCRKFSQIIPDQNILLILITHLISDPSPGGLSEMPDSGRKIRYAADTILQVKYIQRWCKGSNDEEQIGQQIHWIVGCATNGKPGTRISSWLRYGKGIDEAKEAVEIATEFGLIEKAGAWYYPYGKDNDTKCQGMEKFLNWVNENPDYIKEVTEKIREISV